MSTGQTGGALPIVDVAPLLAGAPGAGEVAAQIRGACCEHGFFYITGHGVSAALQEQLVLLSRRFFALDEATKMEIAMARGGRAWRGYFPLGGELTSGRPDQKEGIYFGAELPPELPAVRAGTPLHGANLFPRSVPELGEVVLRYMDALTTLGHGLMRGLALSLGLPAQFFWERYTADPLVLFRIFNYPADGGGEAAARWGVGEHTDYGVLTLLLQDDCGGLEVKTRGGWISAPPVPGTLVCNIGDMLDRMTGGLYRSTPHRVRNRGSRDRLSFPFFFDPSFTARVGPIAIPGSTPLPDDGAQRWDGQSVHAFEGTYGDYILGKVAKVFPALASLQPEP